MLPRPPPQFRFRFLSMWNSFLSSPPTVGCICPCSWNWDNSREIWRDRAESWEPTGVCDTISIFTDYFVFFIEGSWDRVHQVIGQAHTILHQKGIVRIHTDIRVGTRWVCFFFVLCPLLILSCVIHFSLLTVYIRTDKVQSFEDKVTKVQQILGKK